MRRSINGSRLCEEYKILWDECRRALNFGSAQFVFLPSDWFYNQCRSSIINLANFIRISSQNKKKIKNAARSRVIGGPSVTCSTEKTVERNASLSKTLTCQVRCSQGVRVHAATTEGMQETKVTENLIAANCFAVAGYILLKSLLLLDSLVPSLCLSLL